MELKKLGDFWKEEDGMGTVEVILIIVVLVGLVIIFKSQITKVVKIYLWMDLSTMSFVNFQ